MAKKDELLNSNYDGIQEFDNDLPKWWLAIFYISMIYGGIYVLRYHIMDSSSTSETRLAEEMKEIRALQEANAPKGIDQATLLKYVNDKSRIEAGASVFAAKCLACHGPQAQGLVGPNLTDEFWIHGGKLIEIEHTIENGVLDKGMLAWKGVLSDEEIINTVVYIRSLSGSNPPNPKAPQGEKYAGDE